MLESSVFVENNGGSASDVRINDGERNSGGSRWPREETLALLKIRSEMDTLFRDSIPKAPLWDEVSRLMKEVLQKQEDLQNKFLEAIEKCEKERIAREEAWKVQEMARIKREQEFLAQEKVIAAAKDAAVLDFLQKITPKSPSLHMPEILNLLFEKPSDKQGINVLEKHSYLQENGIGETSTHADKQDDNSAGENTIQMGSSRWPKAEVEALIMLKTDLDLKYQDNGPKGPLWKEISTCMKNLGYCRSAKRCKEKWENINKYYKRVKYSNKRRPEDAKTCPYFSMLDSLYANKSKKSQHNSNNGGCNLKPEQVLMQMMSQQQQPQGAHQLLGEYGDSVTKIKKTMQTKTTIEMVIRLLLIICLQ